MTIPPFLSVRVRYASRMDEEWRRKVAIWKATVLGPLVSARLEYGDLRALCIDLSTREWEHPDGRIIKISDRTLEQWTYAYRLHGLKGLMPQPRSDAGRSRAIRPEVADMILRAKRENRRRSIRRIIQMLVGAEVVREGELSRSSVHRLLEWHGISKRPGREGVTKERLAWMTEHAGDLWIGDALHLRNPVIGPDGSLRKGYLLSQIDSATRYVTHSYVVLSEGAVAQEYGLREAIMRQGVPRGYYVDRGPAYVAQSLKAICAELGIHLTWAGKGDGAAKGVIERWHRTWREEVEDELPDHPLPIDELNALNWAWLSREYHRRVHGTTERKPLEHMLAEAHEIRPVPRGVDLEKVFMHRDHRTVRKDSTISWRGRWLEVHWSLAGKKVELRYDPHHPSDLPVVFADGEPISDTKLLDRVKNSRRRRRRASDASAVEVEPTGIDPLRQLADEHYRAVEIDGDPDETED